jgi:uncharacterized protein (DUF433 family)
MSIPGTIMSAITFLGHGVYSFPEAARLTGLRPPRVREWFCGRLSEDARKPLLLGDYRPFDGQWPLSFLDLIELFIAGQLREHGISLQSLRRVRGQLERDLKTRHPFCRRELLTDGKKVFTLGLDTRGKEEMIEVLTRQRVFTEILLPFLKRICYDEATKLARRWRVTNDVVIDPELCLGKPTVREVGMATAVLAAAFKANDEDAELVADWYGISPSHVLAATEFEARLVA